jgi:hypothetical protein
MGGLIIPRIDDFSALADAEAQRVRTKVLDKLAADSARYLSVYSERFENVLNADDAATLFDEYNADRARFRVAVHPAATWVRDELFRRCLAVAPADDAYIVFTAGCNAAGKTTVIRSSRVCKSAHAIFDSTLSNLGHARDLIARTLVANWRITVLHIDRPPDEALLGMLERSRFEGRVVHIGQIINSHRGAAETVRALWNDFRSDYRFAFRFVANTAQDVRPGSLELTQPRDYTGVRTNLHELLRAEYRAGRITETVYDRVRGTGE